MTPSLIPLHRQDMYAEIIRMLRARRQNSGITQTALAAEMGVLRPELSHWERLDGIPRMSTLCKWCRALGLMLTVETT